MINNNNRFNLNNIEIDALNEVANIGIGSASIALSNIFRKKVSVNLPNLKVAHPSDIAKYICKEKEMIVGMYSKLKEGLDGDLMMLIPIKSALDITSFFSKKKTGNMNLSNKDEFIIKKIVMAIYISYLSSLAKFFEKKIIFDPPNLICALPESILNFTMMRLGNIQTILIIKLEFDIENTNIKGDFTLLFTIDSSTPLVTLIRSKILRDQISI